MKTQKRKLNQLFDNLRTIQFDTSLALEKLIISFLVLDSPEDDFNDGVVFTNRPLRPGEIFTVQLERTVSKWAGTLEIGVSTANPADLTFPTTMTNVTTSDTYMMTSNGVMHNGVTVLDHYGPQRKRQNNSSRRHWPNRKWKLERNLLLVYRVNAHVSIFHHHR